MNQKLLDKYFPDEYERPEKHRREIGGLLKELLRKNKGKSFLEIGLGPKVRVGRGKLIQKMGIDYTGMDFEETCDLHRNELKTHGIDNFKFYSNRVGTYLYNLIRLKREGKKFDVIYMDGHHTLYVDFPAVFACFPLLKPGSYICFDDVRWNLADKKNSLQQNTYYKDMYQFEMYEECEQSEKHISVILKEFVLPNFDLEIVEEFSNPGWITLQAKSNWKFS